MFFMQIGFVLGLRVQLSMCSLWTKITLSHIVADVQTSPANVGKGMLVQVLGRYDGWFSIRDTQAG